MRGKLKIRSVVAIILILNVFILASVPAQAASSRAILSYTAYANTPSGNVGLKASLVVQDSTRTIVSISNVQLSSTMGNIKKDSVVFTAPINYGNYAYVTVTYSLNGSVFTESCTFYPL